MNEILPLRCSSIGNYRVDDVLCPANWKQLHDHPDPATKEMKFGTAWHAVQLNQLIDGIDPYNWLLNQVTEKRQSKQFSQEDVNDLIGMKDVFTCNKTAMRLLEGCTCEGQLQMEIDGVLLTGKPDAVGKRIIELKTTANASPAAFARSVINYGYHYQAAGYRLLTGINDYIWIAQEKTPPYLLAIYPAGESLLNTAEMELHDILKLHRNCCLNDDWPGYELIADNRAGIMPAIELPGYYKQINLNL